MEKAISLAGRGVLPCPHHAGEAHPYDGSPLRPEELLALLGRALARHAQLGLAIDNLRRVLVEERLLLEERQELAPGFLEEIRQALSMAQAVIPGAQREALDRITRALDRLDLYQERQAPRGLA
jgi:hypothetical protein